MQSEAGTSSVLCFAEFDFVGILTRAIAAKEAKIVEVLRGFYTLVPALTLCAIEANLLFKEQLSQRKAGSVAAAFADDGFALGLAFLLKVLLLCSILHSPISVLKHLKLSRLHYWLRKHPDCVVMTDLEDWSCLQRQWTIYSRNSACSQCPSNNRTLAY